MKILLASIPATGHFNPILVAARMLKEAGHETAVYTSVIFRDKIEKAGVRFFALPEDADQGWRDLAASILEKHKVTPSPEEMVKLWTSVFVNPMISQFRGLQAVLKEFPAEVVIHETTFAGVLPMLLGPRSERPARVYLGISALYLKRADGAPWGPGLLPSEDPEKRREYRGSRATWTRRKSFHCDVWPTKCWPISACRRYQPRSSRPRQCSQI